MKIDFNLTDRQITTLEIGYDAYLAFLDDNVATWTLLQLNHVVFPILVVMLAFWVPEAILVMIKFHVISLITTLIMFRFTRGYARIKDIVDTNYRSIN